MKTLRLAFLCITLIIISYLLSCDMNKNTFYDPITNNEGNNLDTFGECNEYPDRCPFPSSCNNGKGEHFCLIIYYGDTYEEFDYENIKTVRVTHTGKDCNNNNYYCKYVIPGGGQSYMGCVLPWCDDDCIYTRTVCLETYDDKVYSGSRTFSYSEYTGCQVTVYLSTEVCDFGGIDINED